MHETLKAAKDGIGLAAPQVGILKQVVVLEVDGIKLELINPEIIDKKGSCEGVEGCLSVKNIEGYVTRPETIKVKAFNRLGEELILTCTGLLCRCICHEIDHLHGILFTDIMNEVYVPKNTRKDNK